MAKSNCCLRLPDEWSEGEVKGMCTRGAFVINMKWEKHKVTRLEVFSKQGGICRIETGNKNRPTQNGKNVKAKTNADGSIEFMTAKGATYTFN